jgi:undecaprenyl-diphosphatase
MDKVIDLLRSIILGLMYGLGEIVPVSGRGHVVIFGKLFGFSESLLPMFLLSAGFGTSLALLHHFRVDLKNMLVGTFKYGFKKDFTRKADVQELVKVLVTAIPVVILGLILKRLMPVDDMLSTGFALIVTGALLITVFRMKDIPWKTDLTLKDAFVLGIFQVFALFPSLSRTATTISGGLFQKVELRKTVRFALIVYLMAFLPLLLFSIGDVSVETDQMSIINCLVAMIASFVATKVGIIWMLKMFRIRYLSYLGFYGLILGLFSMVMYMTM